MNYGISGIIAVLHCHDLCFTPSVVCLHSYCSLDSKNTFVNHGCNSSELNVGSIDDTAALFADGGDSGVDDDDDDDEDEVDGFNLVTQRLVIFTAVIY